MLSLLAGIVAAVFGVERVTRWVNRRFERQRINDEIWQRVRDEER